MNKKSVEIQFNWMLVLVAGTAIILFFAAVVVKQKNVSEISAKATILKSVESIIASTSISSDTISIVDIPNIDIDVACDKVSIGGASKQYQKLVLFAPSLIRGDRLITQTLTFNAPYRATNFLYMTSPKVRYIIIGTNDLAKEVNRTLPIELKKEFYSSVPLLKSSDNYKVKFVFFDSADLNNIDLKNFEKMRNVDVTAILIIGDGSKGEVDFYQKDGIFWALKAKSAYLGKAPLIGAINTDTFEAYKCNMQNSFSRLDLVTKIYIERTKELEKAAKANGQVQCEQVYKNSLSSLNRISAAVSDFSNANVDDIVDAANSLASENNNAQIYSCTLIY